MNNKNLPIKVCKTCKKDFSWRKKWKSCWDQVLYCSKRCRRNNRVHKRRFARLSIILALYPRMGGSKWGVSTPEKSQLQTKKALLR